MEAVITSRSEEMAGYIKTLESKGVSTAERDNWRRGVFAVARGGCLHRSAPKTRGAGNH